MREWLKDLREKKGYTQAQMGEKLGVTRQQYSHIENMERQEKLKFETAIKLANIFKISLKRIKEYEEVAKQESEEKKNESITNFQQP